MLADGKLPELPPAAPTVYLSKSCPCPSQEMYPLLAYTWALQGHLQSLTREAVNASHYFAIIQYVYQRLKLFPSGHL